MAYAASGGGEPISQLTSIEHLVLGNLQLQVDDALAGVQGRFAVDELSLDRFAPRCALTIAHETNAELTQPAMNAALELNARLELQASPPPGAPTAVRLDKAALHMLGRGLAAGSIAA